MVVCAHIDQLNMMAFHHKQKVTKRKTQNAVIEQQWFLIWQNGTRFQSSILNFFNLAKNQSFLDYVLTRNYTSHEIREPEDQQF
jgi:hypothetical protein